VLKSTALQIGKRTTQSKVSMMLQLHAPPKAGWTFVVWLIRELSTIRERDAGAGAQGSERYFLPGRVLNLN
jgi:hypothetical protein